MTDKAFPDCIDNTIRTAAAICLTQAKYAYTEDLSAPGDSVHLHFGGAVAAGLEETRRAYHDGGFPPFEAVAMGAARAEEYYGDFEPPFKSPKTRDAAGKAIVYYFHTWPIDTDSVQPTRDSKGELRVEWRFKVPIPDLMHPDHGGPIYLVGRSDMIPTLQGMVIIEDDKTAGQLGASWVEQWTMDSQPTTYIWAAQQEGILVPTETGTALFRGVGIYTPKYIKTGTDTPVKGDKDEDIESGKVIYSLEHSFGHSQAIIYRTPWMVARWLDQLKIDVDRLIYAYMNDQWTLALHKSACAAYGKPCPFVPLCSSEHPEQWKAVNFVKRKWNPLETV